MCLLHFQIKNLEEERDQEKIALSKLRAAFQSLEVTTDMITSLCSSQLFDEWILIIAAQIV